MSVPAFPHDRDQLAFGGEGMTLRDYFAAKAMPVFIQSELQKPVEQQSEKIVALLSYTIADAMLAERAKGES